MAESVAKIYTPEGMDIIGRTLMRDLVVASRPAMRRRRNRGRRSSVS
jgi:hypothetical protein